MNRQDVEKTITEYLKPIFGFAVKRCKNMQNAEDLSQEIVIRAFRALLMKDDVEDMGRFIIKEKHKDELSALKAPYAKAVLSAVPAHLRKVKEYELQFVFHSDGWFLLHCIKELLGNGKLKEPTEGQRKALTTLLINS